MTHDPMTQNHDILAIPWPHDDQAMGTSLFDESDRRLQYCRVPIIGPYIEDPIIYSTHVIPLHNLSRLRLPW